MLPRDIVKLAFQFQEHPEVPFSFNASPAQEAGLTAHYGDESWRQKARPYMCHLSGVDNFLSLAGFQDQSDGTTRDVLGCIWKMGSTHHLVESPLKGPSLAGYRLPDMAWYIDTFVRPQWQQQMAATAGSFRIICHSFGLFERAWSLRGFNQFCMDMHDHPAFSEKLIEMIADWMLESTASAARGHTRLGAISGGCDGQLI